MSFARIPEVQDCPDACLELSAIDGCSDFRPSLAIHVDQEEGGLHAVVPCHLLIASRHRRNQLAARDRGGAH
jgi:hypothetical protein